MGVDKSKIDDGVLPVPSRMDLLFAERDRSLIMPDKLADAGQMIAIRSLLGKLAEGEATQEDIVMLYELTGVIMESRGRTELLTRLTQAAEGGVESQERKRQAMYALARAGSDIQYRKRDIYSVKIGYVSTDDGIKKQVYIDPQQGNVTALGLDPSIAKDLEFAINQQVLPFASAEQSDIDLSDGMIVKGIPMFGNIRGKNRPFILIPTGVGGTHIDFQIILLPIPEGDSDMSNMAKTTFGGTLKMLWRKESETEVTGMPTIVDERMVLLGSDGIEKNPV